MTATEKQIAGMFVGVSDEAFAAAAARRDTSVHAATSKDHEVREGRRAALEVYPNAMRKIAAADSSEPIDSEELISRAQNHLAARDEADDHIDGDDRLVAAAKCLLQAIEQRDNPDTARGGAHGLRRIAGRRAVRGMKSIKAPGRCS